MTVILEARDVWRVYDSGAMPTEALRGVDLKVAAGEFVSFMGRSGSGKSTLLQLLGGLDRPTRGRVLVEGVDLSAISPAALANIRNAKVGFVFQAFNLLASLTVAENVALPAIIARRRPAQCREQAAEAMELVELGDKGDRLPGQLSGGECQRAAIARALVMHPAVVLADEPTGNLDSAASDGVMEALSACHSRGQTVLLVTHDPSVARRAERIMYLHDGRLVDRDLVRQDETSAPLADSL